jgi:NitT/TauT family transport system ATP-binding protein
VSTAAPNSAASTPLLASHEVRKYYGQDRTPVLERVTVELRDGEFVALLGPSGSGKSTLLRILAGLMQPSEGEVLVHGVPLHGANTQVAIVFQSFALFPWLTVFQNVELGLLDLDLTEPERRARALKAIDLIGLDGFEEAFPKELSGGMRQRVGFARALVVQPEVLFMDEPFSALDVQTRSIMSTELLHLWDQTKPAVVFVTHDLEEAIALADKVVVITAGPGTVKAEFEIDLPRPRVVQEIRFDPRFTRLYEQIWEALRTEVAEAYARTTRLAEVAS